MLQNTPFSTYYWPFRLASPFPIITDCPVLDMKYVLDMVHHNPGEPATKSRFLDPDHLASYGFNGQVFKHINCIATYGSTGVDCFPEGSPDREWIEKFTPPIEREIAAAKARGLDVFYHVDLFVLPKRLVEHFRDEICDPVTGRILLDRPRTMELHRILFDELVAKFPEVDGYIIRVGETYLMDTPFHVGNGPIPRTGEAWTPTYLYEQTLGLREHDSPAWSSFLREEICVKHERSLIFRTWDTFPDKLHACEDHYLEITDQIRPHPALIFSIKHTALDFWRRVKTNPCLGRGKHPQIIEVQCQREYEGKGAFPNYVMDGVINGFEENRKKIGLSDFIKNPLTVGIYNWSRGGGWYGPYIKSEFWPDLNAFVLAGFTRDPSRSEIELFNEYAAKRMGLVGGDVPSFRKLCLLSARAVLKGRHCEAFDVLLDEAVLPTACWMRDDRLGGNDQLAIVLDSLASQGRYDEALEEKAEAVAIWDEISELADNIDWSGCDYGEFIKVSVEYGCLLFKIVNQGWRVLIAGHRGDSFELSDAIARYDEHWRAYKALADTPLCSSLYRGEYFSLPGMPAVGGMDESVARYRNTPIRSN
jgi:hypothetical protein